MRRSARRRWLRLPILAPMTVSTLAVSTLAVSALAVSALAVSALARAASAREEVVGPLLDLHDETDFVPQTAGVTVGAPAGWINPAAWAAPASGEAAFWWNDRNLRRGALDNWGLAIARQIGFAVNSRVYGLPGGRTERITDYQLGFSGGGRSEFWGFAYRWSGGGPREPALALGFLERPWRAISFGITGQTSIRSSARQALVDLGIRPTGTDRITLFGEYTLGTRDEIGDGRWTAGALIRPVDGLHLGAKIRDRVGRAEDYRLAFEVGVTLNSLGLHVLQGADEDGDPTDATYLVRLGAPQRGLAAVEPFWPPRGGRPRYVVVNLAGKRIAYQKYRWFDNDRVAWIDLARYLDAVVRDPQIDGVAINLQGLRIPRVLAWEFGQQIDALRAANKKVIVAIDRVWMAEYALATHADRIIIDPQGGIALPGVAMSRTYLKGMLDKLGLGVQELRYFTYKSAAEELVREAMSEADREQRQRVIEVLYEHERAAVAKGRDIGAAAIDTLVNDEMLILPQPARECRLVDAVGTWSDLQMWIAHEKGGSVTELGRNYRPQLFPEEHWGEPARIALVYARGFCDMETGIRGRATSDYLRRLRQDPRVVAVVLRVDSPGGDGMASEAVASAVRALKASGKPVIVSQGDVAASGGYWLSMDGTEVLTTPVTLTGSIGVIGFWLYDDGFGQKLGLTSDGVQVGKHADLFRTLRVPLLGFGPPLRALDAEELELVRERILALYDDFVARVAKGRGLSEERVRELGEGRVWVGGDAIERGLCDRFGTLLDALELARERAGLPRDREVTVVEYPPRELFRWPSFGPRISSPFGVLARIGGWFSSLLARAEEADFAQATRSASGAGVAGADAYVAETGTSGQIGLADEDGHAVLNDYLRLLAEARGQPLALLPLDYLTLR